jgi:hypothetical protein
MSLDLIVRNSLASVELLNSTPDFCVDGFAVLGEPSVLLLLCFEQVLQDLLDVAGGSP